MQRSPGWVEPRHWQGSQNNPGDHGKVHCHLHHHLSHLPHHHHHYLCNHRHYHHYHYHCCHRHYHNLHKIFRFRDLPPDPTECGCLKTLVFTSMIVFLYFSFSIQLRYPWFWYIQLISQVLQTFHWIQLKYSKLWYIQLNSFK